MDDRTRLTRVTDDRGREIITVPIEGASNRRWRRAWGGSIVGEEGTLRAIGDGRTSTRATRQILAR